MTPRRRCVVITATSLRMEREWAMPSAWTFTIPPIKGLLLQEGAGIGEWADPFCGKNSPCNWTNDLDPENEATSHMDANLWLRTLPTEHFDGCIFDPPYSITRAAELYKGFGAQHLALDETAEVLQPGSMGYWASIKNEMARITKPGGKVICCGWSSNGLGEGRGFRMTRLLLVPHGGSKNDTIVTVEVKQQGRLI